MPGRAWLPRGAPRPRARRGGGSFHTLPRRLNATVPSSTSAPVILTPPGVNASRPRRLPQARAHRALRRAPPLRALPRPRAPRSATPPHAMP